MRYENEPCCGCTQPLCPKTEDIVVCPDCGAPMHRHCWQAASGCPKATEHAEGFAWQPTQALPSFDPKAELGQLCPNCGENCAPDTNFCQECGTSLAQEGDTFQSMFQRVQQESLRQEAYVKENFPTYQVNGRTLRMGDNLAGHPMEEISLQLRGPHRSVARYLARFETGRQVGWNWAAFLLGPYWFFFRKLYKPALAFAGLALVLSLALVPVNMAVNDQVFGGTMPSVERMMEAAGSPEMQQVIEDNRVILFALGGLWLGSHITAALLADNLLRRRVFGNIARMQKSEVGVDGEREQSGAEVAARRLTRHRMLARMGGFSFLAPVLCFWALRFLPDLILQLIQYIIG